MNKLNTPAPRVGRAFAGLWSCCRSDHGPGLRPAAFALALALLAVPLHAGTCTINVGSNQQTIDGFGFASVWAPVMTSAQAATFFGTGSGQLGFSLLRVYVSETGDFSPDASNASLAHSYGAKVLGTAWTPPPAMKSNDNSVGGTLNTSEYAAYASYLASAATSIGVDYVSFQNEPDITVTYQSCSWTPAEMETWAANNAPTVGKPIVMPESYHFDDSYSDPTLDNSTADNNVTIIAGHIYGGGNIVHQNALNHGKHVWMTEHYNSGQDITTSITDAKEISDCMNNQMSAYFWWRAYHSPANTTDDLVNGSTPEKNGYAIGQFARWVRPGKVRCATTYNPTTSIYVTAYHTNGLVIVAINTGGSSVNQTFTIQNASVPSVTPYQTSSTENMAQLSTINTSSGTFTATLPAQSVTTFVE